MGKHTVIGFAISILFVCFVVETVNTIFPPPKWEREDSSYSVGDSKTDNKDVAKRDNQRWKEYEKAQKKWAPYAFVVSSAMGILALIVGALVIKIPGVSGGLMGGGTLAIIGGYIPAQMSGIGSHWKFIYLLLVLCLLIWIGSRKLNESPERRPP